MKTLLKFLLILSWTMPCLARSYTHTPELNERKTIAETFEFRDEPSSATSQFLMTWLKSYAGKSLFVGLFGAIVSINAMFVFDEVQRPFYRDLAIFSIALGVFPTAPFLVSYFFSDLEWIPGYLKDNDDKDL